MYNDHPSHQRPPPTQHPPSYFSQAPHPNTYPQYPSQHASNAHAFHADHESSSTSHRIHAPSQRSQEVSNSSHFHPRSPPNANRGADHFDYRHSQYYPPPPHPPHGQQHAQYTIPLTSAAQPVAHPSSRSQMSQNPVSAPPSQSARNMNPSTLRHLSTSHVSDQSFYNSRDQAQPNRSSLMQQAPLGTRHYSESSNPNSALSPVTALPSTFPHNSDNSRAAQVHPHELTKIANSRNQMYHHNGAPNERNLYASSFHPSAQPAAPEHAGRVGRSSFSPLRIVASSANANLRRDSTPVRYMNGHANVESTDNASFSRTNFCGARPSPITSRHNNQASNILYKYSNRLDDSNPVTLHNPNTSAVTSRLAAITKSCYLTIASISEAMEDYTRAQAAYEQILEHAPRSIEALTKLANIHRSRDQFDRAVELFERAVALDPTSGEVHAALGYCHLMADDLERSFQSYQLALNHLPNPTEPKLWYGIGILYDRWACFDNAEVAFATALRNDPNFEKANEIYFRLGVIYKQQSKWDDALRCFQYILGNPPTPLNDLDIHLQIGHCYEQQGRHHLAKDAYNLILATDPNHARAYQQLGWLHHIAGQSALSNDDRAADQSRLPANAADNNDENSTQAGGPADLKAVELLERAAELDPDDAQTFYLLGRVHMTHRHYNLAHDAYQQAVYRDPRNPSFWCSIGVLYFQIRQYRDALDAYSRAIRINSRLSEVWYDLGTLYEACNNQLHDAMDAYERAASLDPQNVHIRQRLEYVRDVIARGAGGSEENNARIEPANPRDGDHETSLASNANAPPPLPSQVDAAESKGASIPSIGAAATPAGAPLRASDVQRPREFSRTAAQQLGYNATRHFPEEQALGRPRAASQSVPGRLVSQQHLAQAGSPAQRREPNKEQNMQELQADVQQRLPSMDNMRENREASLPESMSASTNELQPVSGDRRNDRSHSIRTRDQRAVSAQDRRPELEAGKKTALKRGDTLGRIVELDPRSLVRGNLDEDYDEDDEQQEAQDLDQKKKSLEPSPPLKALDEASFPDTVRPSSKTTTKKRRANEVGARAGMDSAKSNAAQAKHPGDEDLTDVQHRKRLKNT